MGAYHPAVKADVHAELARLRVREGMSTRWENMVDVENKENFTGNPCTAAAFKAIVDHMTSLPVPGHARVSIWRIKEIV